MQVEIQRRQQQIEEIINRLLQGDDHLSYSSLSAFKESPKSFIDYKLGRRKETDAMIYGSMVHCLFLEPDDFENRYHVLNDADICGQIGGAKPRATKAYKEWRTVAMQEAAGKILVETSDYNAALAVSINLRENQAATSVLHRAHLHEIPVDWEFKNFKFKGFIDGEGEKLFFDLKTCPDAEPKKFQRTIYDQKYYLQAAMYMYAKGRAMDSYIIAADKEGGVSVHKLEQALIEQGMREYEELLNRFNHCILTDGFDKSYDFYSDRFDGTFMCEKPTWMY